MGNAIERYNCVDLSQLPADDFAAIINESYTVHRNPKTPNGIPAGQPGAIEEDGWKMRSTCHSTECGQRWGVAAHATNRVQGSSGLYEWKYFMDNGFVEDNTHHVHACGWRTCDKHKRTFWPTRLKTQVEREAWWAWLEERVSTLSYPVEKIEQ